MKLPDTRTFVVICYVNDIKYYLSEVNVMEPNQYHRTYPVNVVSWTQFRHVASVFVGKKQVMAFILSELGTRNITLVELKSNTKST